MKLSQLISTLQKTMDENGDTEHVALCFVVDDGTPFRVDVVGSVTVLHDDAEYPNGMAYLVADQNLRVAKIHDRANPAAQSVS